MKRKSSRRTKISDKGNDNFIKALSIVSQSDLPVLVAAYNSDLKQLVYIFRDDFFQMEYLDKKLQKINENSNDELPVELKKEIEYLENLVKRMIYVISSKSETNTYVVGEKRFKTFFPEVDVSGCLFFPY